MCKIFQPDREALRARIMADKMQAVDEFQKRWFQLCQQEKDLAQVQRLRVVDLRKPDGRRF